MKKNAKSVIRLLYIASAKRFKMKQTDKNIAKFYDTTPQTLYNWKTSDKQGVRERYEALKNYFIEQTKDKR